MFKNILVLDGTETVGRNYEISTQLEAMDMAGFYGMDGNLNYPDIYRYIVNGGTVVVKGFNLGIAGYIQHYLSTGKWMLADGKDRPVSDGFKMIFDNQTCNLDLAWKDKMISINLKD
jgi:hypothetical protein